MLGRTWARTLVPFPRSCPFSRRSVWGPTTRGQLRLQLDFYADEAQGFEPSLTSLPGETGISELTCLNPDPWEPRQHLPGSFPCSRGHRHPACCSGQNIPFRTPSLFFPQTRVQSTGRPWRLRPKSSTTRPLRAATLSVSGPAPPPLPCIPHWPPARALPCGHPRSSRRSPTLGKAEVWSRPSPVRGHHPPSLASGLTPRWAERLNGWELSSVVAPANLCGVNTPTPAKPRTPL